MLAICSKCKLNHSVFKRAYSGETLCKSCFLFSIEHKTLHAISKYSMIRYGERIAVGVSGGKDSLTLLCVLQKILKKNNHNDLVAITIDEGIEGYRDESINIVKTHCEKIKIPLKIFSYKDLFGKSMDAAMDDRPSNKISSCSMCGTFRRRALDVGAKLVGANVLATAHNLDDFIHTFMINLFSGDIDRIGWMYPVPIEYDTGLKKIKPFIEIYENEIVFYAFNTQVEFQTEQCPYMNESIRSDFRKIFNDLEKIHPGIKYNCFNSINKISKIIQGFPADGIQHSRYLKKTCSKCGNITNNEFCSVCKMISLLDTK
ncbi:MAG: TIGR00269 family protein [Candidatus Nitrosocosmicus sp.]